MNIVKSVANHLLSLYAGFYIFRGRYDKAIHYYKKAYTLNPHDQFVLLELAGCYSKIKAYEEGKNILEKALINNPNDYLLNQSFITVLHEKGEPIEQLVPYIRVYFQNKPREKTTFPLIIRLLIKIFRPKFDWGSHTKTFDNHLSEWDNWAQDILRRYDHSEDSN